MALGRLSVGVGRKGKAAPHAQYIAREGKYTKPSNDLEKLEFTGQGNMPLWAEAEPNFFWQMSDQHERANGSAYREHVIALPRELSIEQRHDLMKAWIETEIGDKHAYQYAIHNPPAMDGLDQPHCHLMFSERTIDGIDRDPDQYFKRYNSKNPERGGAKKANTGMHPKARKGELKAQRDRWEHVCNEHLVRAGSKSRINMKSYKDRGFNYIPLNMTMVQIQKPEVKAAYKKHLQAKRERFACRMASKRMGIPQELRYQQRKQDMARQAEQARIEKAADIYFEIGKYDPKNPYVTIPTPTRALFSNRQLRIIEYNDELSVHDKYEIVCQQLALPEHADIVALLLDPAASRYHRQELLPLYQMGFLERNTRKTLEDLHKYHTYFISYLDDEKEIDIDFFKQCQYFNSVLDTFNEQLERETRFTYDHDKLDTLKTAHDESKKLFDNVFKELADKDVEPDRLDKEEKDFALTHDKLAEVMGRSRETTDRIAQKKQSEQDNKPQQPSYRPPRPR